MKRKPALRGLLRLRRVRERQAAAELAGARAAETAARAHLEALRLAAGTELPLADLLRPAQLRALQLQGIASQEQLRQAAARYEEARRRTVEAAGGWHNRKLGADAAERLVAEAHRRSAARATRAAERSLDDLLGMLRYRRRGAS